MSMCFNWMLGRPRDNPYGIQETFHACDLHPAGEKILRWDTTSWQLLPPILTKDELARTDIRPP